MGIFDFFKSHREINRQDAEKLMGDLAAGEYTLLDVRTRKEYERGHLPEATWIPLAELADRLDELDHEKPLIAYCAVGGRSGSAAQLLEGRGFKEVYSLAGGIKKWHGLEAVGPPELGMAHMSGQESPAEILALCYDLEDNLARFYHTLGERASDREVIELFAKLASWEEAHKSRLAARYGEVAPQAVPLSQAAAGRAGGSLEGGFSMESLLAPGQESMHGVEGVLEAAITIEAQAMDLYFRFSQVARDEGARQAMLELVQEEKGHLAALSELLESKQ